MVAQMLDYAANAALWEAEKIKSWLDARCQAQEGGSTGAIEDALGSDDSNQQEFWNRVKSNLGSRRIRLIFVADKIEAELETIVLFMNEQMKHTTVVALELAQFTDGASRILDVITGDRNLAPIYLRANGRIALPLGTLMRMPAFESESMRQKLAEDLRTAGFILSTSALDGEPSFNAPSLDGNEKMGCAAPPPS